MKAFHPLSAIGGDRTASRGAPRHPKHAKGRRRRLFAAPNRVVAAGVVMSLVAAIGHSATIAAQAVTAPVGEGFTVTASDLAFILKQIKIAERHAFTRTPDKPCSTLLSTPADGIPDAEQVPDALTSYGLRTVDGSCNNLKAGDAYLSAADQPGAADQPFPRLTSANFRPAEGVPADFFGPGSPAVPSSTYADHSPGNMVFDSQPRLISNLIVDQTLANPAAIMKGLQSGGLVEATLANVALVQDIYNAFKPALDAEYQARVVMQNAKAAANQLSDGDESTVPGPAEQAAIDAFAAATAAQLAASSYRAWR